MLISFLLLVSACTALAADSGATPSFKVGQGIGDVTGPAAEIDFMGYAFPGQTGRGIHLRQFSRAFVIEDANGNRVVYASVDVCMTMLSMKSLVVEQLQNIYGPDLYTNDNVLISGIHTHSGPGGFSWYLLYDASQLGFQEENLNAVVAGIVASIVEATNRLEANGPTSITMSVGELLNTNINRSPSSYLSNPASERALYAYDVDKTMTVLKFVTQASQSELGMIAFFPVHCVSMHNTNRLISSDNKGYASILFEQFMSPTSLIGQGEFVAAFGQSNEGDVTPNTLGAWCSGIVNGTYCGDDHSVCNGRNELCYGVGPAGFVDDFGSTKIIGTQEFEAAKGLYDNATTPITGTVDYIHAFINISNIVVTPEFTGLPENVTTCRPAVGMSFAAGTTDGPGAFNFVQGDNCTSCNPFWKIIGGFLKAPTPEQIKCQAPKPILFDVGQIEPYPWVPPVVPIQLIRIGNIVLAGVPGEFTTMSGRRLRNTIETAFAEEGMNVTCIIAGLSNTYTQYIATYEEYQDQRYEAASTLFGPHTLTAYQQEFTKLAKAMATGGSVPPGQAPTNTSTVNFNLVPPVLFDTHPIGKEFGSVQSDVNPSYVVGEIVNVTFYGANPRNNYMTGKSFLTVEIQSGSSWEVVATDANWETKFTWAPHDLTGSLVGVEWTIPSTATPGTYRIQTFGYYKVAEVSKEVLPYSGTSSSFTVKAS